MATIHLILIVILHLVWLREKKKVEKKNNPHLWVINLDTVTVTKDNFENLNIDFNKAKKHNKSTRNSKTKHRVSTDY